MAVTALFVRSCDVEMVASPFIYMLFLLYFRGCEMIIF